MYTTYTSLFYRVHEFERERVIRLFNKHNEFRADGSTLEEVDTDLNEKRREESEHFIELLSRYSYIEHVSIRHFQIFLQREN